MDFRMVPVPEEFVLEALEFVVRVLDEARQDAWSPALLQRVLDGVDPAMRRLADLVAQATVENRPLPQPEAADALGTSVRALLGLVREVNARSIDLGRPRLLMLMPMIVAQPDGTYPKVPCITMESDVATSVLALRPS